MMFINDISIDFSGIGEQGITVAVIGYLIVFLALLLSFLVFSNIPKIIYYKTRKEFRKQKKQQLKQDDIHLSGDLTAAIASALYLYYNELHDPESNIITIKRVRKRYSPWSSKIYGLRKWPTK